MRPKWRATVKQRQLSLGAGPLGPIDWRNPERQLVRSSVNSFIEGTNSMPSPHEFALQGKVWRYHANDYCASTDTPVWILPEVFMKAVVFDKTGGRLSMFSTSPRFPNTSPQTMAKC